MLVATADVPRLVALLTRIDFLHGRSAEDTLTPLLPELLRLGALAARALVHAGRSAVGGDDALLQLLFAGALATLASGVAQLQLQAEEAAAARDTPLPAATPLPPRSARGRDSEREGDEQLASSPRVFADVQQQLCQEVQRRIGSATPLDVQAALEQCDMLLMQAGRGRSRASRVRMRKR